MKSKWSKRLLSLGAVVLGVLADYFTKLIAVSRLKGEDPVPLIRGILRFSYVENRGAAWGMLSDHRWVFMLFSAVAIVVVLLVGVQGLIEAAVCCLIGGSVAKGVAHAVYKE